MNDVAVRACVSFLWFNACTFFFVYSDLLTPYAYAPPWTPLNPEFYSIFGGLSKYLLVLHDRPPWKVALCLPYPTLTFTPTLASMGWNDQLWNTLAFLFIATHVSHIVDYSPSALLPPGELATDGMRFRLGRTFFRDADPHKSYGENLLVYHPWKIEQP